MMNKQEFEELSIINKMLGNKYDAVVQQLGTELAFGMAKNQEFIGFSAFKAKLEKLLKSWREQIKQDFLLEEKDSKYSLCRISDIATLKTNISESFSAGIKWAYIKALAAKLIGVITTSITLKELYNTWHKIITDLINNLDAELVNNNELKSKGERWKLNPKEMDNIAVNIKLQAIVRKEMLNPNDVIFVEKSEKYIEKFEAWLKTEDSELSDLTSLNLKIKTKNLSTQQEHIDTGTTTAPLKKAIIDQLIQKAGSEEYVPTAKLADAAQNIIREYKLLYTDYEGLAFKHPFFSTAYVGATDFQLPTKIYEWLEKNSVPQSQKEIHLSNYLAAFNKWQSIASNVVAIFKSEVKKFKFDKTKLSTALAPLFDNAKTEESQFALVNFVDDFIVDGVTTPMDLDLFQKHWESDKISTNLITKATAFFETIYSQIPEEEWDTLNSSKIFDYLPKTQQLIDALKASRYKAPKTPKPQPPQPDPEPTERKNPIISFKGLAYDQLELILIKNGKTIDSIPYYNGAPNHVEIGEGEPTGDYTIEVRYVTHPNNSDTPLTKEQQIIYKEEAKKESKKEGFLCIFNFANKSNDGNKYSFDLQFIPKKVEVYARIGNTLIESHEINSDKMEGSFSFCYANPTSSISAYASLFEFYLRFDGTASKDVYYTNPLIKDQEGACLGEYTVSQIEVPIIIKFPYDPIKAWLTYDDNPDGTVVSEGTARVASIPSNKCFNLGLNIAVGDLYLHISGRKKGGKITVVSQPVHKKFSLDIWSIRLDGDGANLASNIDYSSLRTEAMLAMGEWTNDFMLELNKLILDKFGKDYAKSQETSTDWWNLINGVFSALPLLGDIWETGGATLKLVGAVGAKILKFVSDGFHQIKGQFKEEEPSLAGMLDKIKKGVIEYTNDKLRTSTVEDQNNLLKLLIDINQEKTTAELKSIVHDTLLDILPKPEIILNKIKGQLDR